jgi:hypothetical protein
VVAEITEASSYLMSRYWLNFYRLLRYLKPATGTKLQVPRHMPMLRDDHTADKKTRMATAGQTGIEARVRLTKNVAQAL